VIYKEFLAALGVGLGLSAGGLLAWLIKLLVDLYKIRYQVSYKQSSDFRLHNLNRQAEAYNSIWISINDFHNIFERLWVSVDENGIKEFAVALSSADKSIRNCSMVIPPHLSIKLKQLLHIVNQYYFGKKRLLEIQTIEGRLEPKVLEDMNHFITRNHEYKIELDSVMEDLTDFFRQALYPGISRDFDNS